MFLTLKMVLNYVVSILSVGKWHFYLEVESACSQQRWVYHFNAICWTYHQYLLVRTKTVHLRQQLIDGWIFLTRCAVTKHAHWLTITYCIDLINVNDRRSCLFCLVEQLLHPFWPHSYINLAELWRIAWKEGHPSLPSSCLGQSSFACTRWAVKNDTLSHSSSDAMILWRVVHKLYDFLQSLLRLLQTYHVLEFYRLLRNWTSVHLSTVLVT